MPVALEIDDLILQEPDREAVVRILTELEFYSLVRRLSGQGDGKQAAVDVAESSLTQPTLDEPSAEPSLSADSWLSLSDLSGPARQR